LVFFYTQHSGWIFKGKIRQCCVRLIENAVGGGHNAKRYVRDAVARGNGREGIGYDFDPR
jgi:hypothetical protein